MSISKRLRGIGGAFLICLILAPIAIFATIILLPVWSWIESTLEIESIGHSGPAEWCYLASYLIILACTTFIWWAFRRRSDL